MTANIYMMRYYVSVQGFINYLEQLFMLELMDPLWHCVMIITYVNIAFIAC